MTPVLIFSAVSILLALAGLAYTVSRNRGSDTTEIARRLTALETKVEIFWRGVTYDAAAILHSPHPEFERRDHLLDRFNDGSITAVEVAELVGMMRGLRDDPGAEAGQRVAASVVLRGVAVWYQVIGV